MQTLITMGVYGVLVLAPEAADDIEISAEAVDFFSASIYFSAMLTGLATSYLVRTIGPTQAFQLMAALVGFGALSFILASFFLLF